MTPKVSSVLCTFGRFKTIRRSVGMWLSQDYEGAKELIIFSTSPVPLVLGETLAKMPNVGQRTDPRGRHPLGKLGPGSQRRIETLHRFSLFLLGRRRLVFALAPFAKRGPLGKVRGQDLEARKKFVFNGRGQKF